MSQCQWKEEKFQDLVNRVQELKSIDIKQFESRPRNLLDEFLKEIKKVLEIESELQRLETFWLPEGGTYFKVITDPSIQTTELAIKTLEEKGIAVSDGGKALINKTEFSKEQQEYDLVEFTCSQLGLLDINTTTQIFARALELGLELCPPEVAIFLRLQYSGKNRKMIAMKQIEDSIGDRSVFSLHSDAEGIELCLGSLAAWEQYTWSSRRSFVFRYRK